MAKKTLSQATYADDNVQQLPVQVKGQASLVQQTFDKGTLDQKTYNNSTLLTELQSETLNDSGAHAIGFGSTQGDITSNNVGDALDEIVTIAKDAQAGELLPGVVTDDKLGNAQDQAKNRLSLIQDIKTATVTASNGDITADFNFVNARAIEILFDTAISAPATLSFNAGTTYPLKDLEGNDIDIETNTLYKAFYNSATMAFQLAPRGSGGNIAWGPQQYNGTNEVLKTEKGKDVTVKPGDIVNGEFGESFINDGGLGQVIPPITKATQASDLVATIAGTLEMSNPQQGDVFLGHISKVNQWLPSMEGADGALQIPNKNSDFEIFQSVASITMSQVLFVTGEGWISHIDFDNVGSPAYVAIEIDGTYIFGNGSSGLELRNGGITLMKRYNTSFRVLVASGTSTSVSGIFYVEGERYSEGTPKSWSGDVSSFVPTLRKTIVGEGTLIAVSDTDNGDNYRIDIDGVQVFPQANESSNLEVGATLLFPFKTECKIYEGSGDVTISYQLN